ncbi:substrate-binding domain-containing protein [Nocardia acididurans]|uniref:substrate-binding domain-containing protein n=1 Tax=Nocardia acididurans TaxID=2802282 RepID=UPI0027DB7F5C|nr:substrate-binding domain-containing protein [Nocardia acididurans]
MNREGKDNPSLLAITDGPVIGGLPELVPRTLALSPYTMITHPGVRLEDLTAADIRRLYQGAVANWSELGGPDLPVRVVHRPTNSGTREMLHQRLLGDGPQQAPRPTVCYAVTPATPGPAFCEADSTRDMLDTVANTPGAIGYSVYYDATKASGVRLVGVDRHRPDPDQVKSGIYPLWSVEYAYSYGTPADDGLAASFLRFLTGGRGSDILREYSAIPCAEIRTSNSCAPTG